MYIDKIIEDIVCFEMQDFNDDDFKNYDIDKNKWYSEGSIWSVYIYAKMSEYYHKNKNRIDKIAKNILKSETKSYK